MAPPAIVSGPALTPGLVVMVEGHITREHAPAVVILDPIYLALGSDDGGRPVDSFYVILGARNFFGPEAFARASADAAASSTSADDENARRFTT